MIVASQKESDRFGLRIARWNPATPDEHVVLDGFDVVIVRRPAAWADRWFELTQHAGFVALHTDSLVYWGTRVRSDHPDLSEGIVIEESDDVALLELVVRDVFDGYQNHYTANPCFDRQAALEGYVEWARDSASASGGFTTVRAPAGIVGFGVVDWTAAPAPDVRLAGILPSFRGRGRYRDLMVALVCGASDRGATELHISTQVHNVAVQRTWASLGWKPFDAFDTTHLIRRGLPTSLG